MSRGRLLLGEIRFKHQATHRDPQQGATTIPAILQNAYLLLTATAIMWAGNAIAGKFAVGHISPFLLTSLRWTLAVAILLPVAWRYIRSDWAAVRANALFLFLLGAIGFTAFNNLLYLALNHTTAINVAIEQAAMPLVVFALNFVLFSIRTSWMQIAGFMLTLLGVGLTATGGDLARLSVESVNVGDLYMIIAMLFYGTYSVALARKPRLHWLTFIATLSVAALIASLPFAAWEILSGRAILPDTQGFAVALYTAIFPAILAQLFWARGLEIIGSNRGGVFINFVPIFGAALAVLLLGEAFRLYHLAAMVMVLGGVWLSQKDPPAPA